MKKIAIVGSGSFLARNFIKYCIDNDCEYKFELYDCFDIETVYGIPSTKIDLLNIESIKRIDFSADIMMMFIGKTGTADGFENYKTYFEVNELMLANFLRVYSDMQSKARIIYPSTRLVYKSNSAVKIKENAERECKSIYAITKQAAEDILKLYRDVFNANVVIIRLCTPIGSLVDDNGSYGTFGLFEKQAIDDKRITVFGDGLQQKTFTLIGDVCKAFSLLINSETVKYFDYNLGGQELSLIDIAKSIADKHNVGVCHTPWPDLYQKVDGGSVMFDSSRFDDEFKMQYTMILKKT